MSQHESAGHAIALADHFIATILEEEPQLLVGSLEELEEDEVRQVARRLAVFRQALIDELVLQPLADEEVEEDEAVEANEGAGD